MSDTRQLSRAAIVRQRRRQDVERRVARSSALASRPVAPITTRGIPQYAGKVYTPAKSARRQYQAAITMPGIEVRMPAINVTSQSLKWRLVSFCLSALVLAALAMIWNSSFMQAGQPQVTGNVRVSSAEIAAVLGATGQPSFLLVPSEMEKQLRINYPEIAAAQVSVGFPNVVSVHVVERTPVIAWQQANVYTWIDAEGVAFRPEGTADNLITVSSRAAPPVGISGLSAPAGPTPYLSRGLVQAIEQLGPNVPAGETMLYDPRYGLGWTDSRGWQVFFGNASSDLGTKLNVYEALVSTLQQQGIAPAFISVQYANAPYYRMSQ